METAVTRTRCSPGEEHITAAVSYSLVESNAQDLSLKAEQVLALKTVLRGADCVVVLPTGYGKSLVYMLLPKAFEYVRGESAVVIVVEPLAALAADQVERAKAMNLLPATLSCHRTLAAGFKDSTSLQTDAHRELYDDLCNGKYTRVVSLRRHSQCYRMRKQIACASVLH